MSDPWSGHMSAAKGVMRYLKGKPNLELTFMNSSHVLTGFCDSSYISPDPEQARSTGYMFFLGSNIISYSSRLQRLVAQSSTESELISAADIAKEAKYLMTLFGELGVTEATRCTLRVDNLGAIILAQHNKFSPRTKHLGVRLHALRYLVRTDQIQLHHVRSKSQRSDLLTKFLSRPEHNRAMEQVIYFTP